MAANPASREVWKRRRAVLIVHTLTHGVNTFQHQDRVKRVWRCARMLDYLFRRDAALKHKVVTAVRGLKHMALACFFQFRVPDIPHDAHHGGPRRISEIAHPDADLSTKRITAAKILVYKTLIHHDHRSFQLTSLTSKSRPRNKGTPRALR
jgi:hypothetical protein